MKIQRKMEKKEKSRVFFCSVLIVMLIGICARGICIASIPGGMNQDEAFGAYEAYSLLHYGMDSSGFSFPVYLNTWGSGMSALNSYLMIPFMWLFGPTVWVARMPQFITSCLSLIVMYRLFSKLFSKRAGLLALTFLAVCPYHVMMARWGLDCNLAPAFLLFGFYFFVCGVENNKLYLASALCYGLALYSYATVWPVVPAVLLLQFLYVLYTKRFHFNRYVIISTLLLVVMAAPLVLFLLVNQGYFDTLTIGKMTIPRLTAMRASDISFDNQKANLKNLLNMLWTQNDGLYWNTTAEYGLYYKGFLLFGCVGVLYGIYRGLKSIFTRKYDPVVLLFFPLLCAFGLGTLIEVNANRINCIHIPVISFIVIGMYLIVEGVSKKLSFLYPVAMAGLLVLFGFFEQFYFTTYAENISAMWDRGLEDAILYAEQLAGTENYIYVDHSIYYPKVMYYSECPVTEYIDTVRYTNYPSEFLDVYSFGQYVFNLNDVTPGEVCIIYERDAQHYEEAGFSVVSFDNIAVAQ